jgi:hypothetical protein
MSRKTTQVNGIQGVATGASASVNMPLVRYHQIDGFVTSNGVAVDIETAIVLVTLKVNGTIIKQLTPKFIKQRALFFGYPQATGQFTLFFTEPRRRGLLGDELSSWDLFDEKSFSIEIKLATGLTSPTLAMQAQWDNKRNGELSADGKTFIKYPGAILREIIFSQNISTNFTITNILPVGVPVHNIFVIPATAGTIQRMELDIDNDRKFEGDTLATYGPNNPYAAYDDYGLTVGTTAGQVYYPISFDYDCKLDSAIVQNSNHNLRLFSSAAQAVDILIESRTSNFN